MGIWQRLFNGRGYASPSAVRAAVNARIGILPFNFRTLARPRSYMDGRIILKQRRLFAGNGSGKLARAQVLSKGTTDMSSRGMAHVDPVVCCSPRVQERECGDRGAALEINWPVP